MHRSHQPTRVILGLCAPVVLVVALEALIQVHIVLEQVVVLAADIHTARGALLDDSGPATHVHIVRVACEEWTHTHRHVQRQGTEKAITTESMLWYERQPVEKAEEFTLSLTLSHILSHTLSHTPSHIASDTLSHTSSHTPLTHYVTYSLWSTQARLSLSPCLCVCSFSLSSSHWLSVDFALFACVPYTDLRLCVTHPMFASSGSALEK